MNLNVYSILIMIILTTFVDIMLDKLIANRQLEFMFRDEVRDCLMLRKMHQYESHKHKHHKDTLVNLITYIKMYLFVKNKKAKYYVLYFKEYIFVHF